MQACHTSHFMDKFILSIFSTAVSIRCGHFSDINECVRDNGGCARDAGCVNFAGSFRCICDDGFTGDGYECRGRTTKLCHVCFCFISLCVVYRCLMLVKGQKCTFSKIIADKKLSFPDDPVFKQQLFSFFCVPQLVAFSFSHISLISPPIVTRCG